MEKTDGMDEAPKDPGAANALQNYTEKDFEGHHTAHAVYVGVHMPGQQRPRSRHRRHHHRRHHGGKESDTDSDRPVTPPSQRVQFILGEDDDTAGHESHPLFSEMEELWFHEDGMAEWKETARWVKFEEDVDEGGNRWSKPHVATLSLHSLFELRSLIVHGTVMLDMEASNLEEIADLFLERVFNKGQLTFEKQDRVKEALLTKHRHQHERAKVDSSSANISKLPLIRSLAEIGRIHSSSKMEEGTAHKEGGGAPSTTAGTAKFGQFLSPSAGAGTSNVQDAIQTSPSMGSFSHNMSSSNLEQHTSNGDIAQKKSNVHFMKKIPPGAEASNILIGEVDFLDKPLSGFIRLSSAIMLADLTEVPVPTRFLFILLGPVGGMSTYHEIGRAIATLMSDEVFHEVAYKAKNRDNLLAGLDEFLDAVTVLPPGEWDPDIRIEPPAALPSQDPRKHGEKKPKEDSVKKDKSEKEDEQKRREDMGLVRTGRLFGGLINDVKRKAPWYFSDFKDSLSQQCIASWLFLYFACLTPIITFGGLLGEATEQHMAAIESLVAGFIVGVGYGFLSGQPLTILGSTGPVLVYETILYDFCSRNSIDYLSLRLWIGLWVGLILILMVAFDFSAFVCYITRFTEENFATLIAFIFIYKAVEKVLVIGDKYPYWPYPDDPMPIYDCTCAPTENTTHPESYNWTLISEKKCNSTKYNGTLVGPSCGSTHYYSDVFLMSLLLFFGTFLVSVYMKNFKNTSFFPSKVRQVISDFAVIIAIVSMTTVDYLSGVNTPKLEVPDKFQPTLEGRTWFVPPFANPWWMCIAALIPALLATILIFMDQQITAVIVNRKENKLKKGCGYHLDLLILAVLIMICSVMGLPWFVAATVLSINHVNSLKMESETAAPGEKPRFLGVREQRVTHILIFLTIGLSVLMTPLLKNIPMPVLFGVFLYMGIASLNGLQFFDRILIMFMPVKYQPDYTFLRKVPLRKVHLFTGVQLTCLVVLWIIKTYKQTSILFPLMLVVMIAVRKLLDFVFTERELKILDDALPESTKRRKEDEQKQKEEQEAEAANLPFASTGNNLQIPLASGNIMKIPLGSVNITEEMKKTSIWKQVDHKNEDKEHSPTKHRSKKRSSGRKDVQFEDEQKRLSTMAEEDEEDVGITIKIDKSPEESQGESDKSSAVNAETSV